MLILCRLMLSLCLCLIKINKTNEKKLHNIETTQNAKT